MGQLKLFALKQVKCQECGTQFVPIHKDLIVSWETDLDTPEDWLTTRNWAVDRVYQDNLVFCSPECIETSVARAAWIELQRRHHKNWRNR